jgi:hypothetical protein
LDAIRPPFAVQHSSPGTCMYSCTLCTLRGLHYSQVLGHRTVVYTAAPPLSPRTPTHPPVSTLMPSSTPCCSCNISWLLILLLQ